jgi:N6-L-threonylcarbamoyladenine synthase
MLLAIETSCDETSAAVVHHGEILSNIVSTQMAMHQEYGGVVPELATREHLRNVQPVIIEALKAAGCSASNLDAIAATRGPGLPSALMVGLKAGQSMAFALGKPFVSVHHHEAHLYSPWIRGNPPAADFSQAQPSVSLIVSGGHTMLVLIERLLQHRVLGATVDDAAGECFDKIAKLIGLPYPGGPHLDRLAAEGSAVYNFPRPMLHDPNFDFSFAGLKTSVRYFLEKNPDLLHHRKNVADLCASVQAAIVAVLVEKTIRAARQFGVKIVSASGGVSCNRGLREGLAKACENHGLKLLIAEGQFCTDNAGMIGAVGEARLNHFGPDRDLDLDPLPSWNLDATRATQS